MVWGLAFGVGVCGIRFKAGNPPTSGGACCFFKNVHAIWSKASERGPLGQQQRRPMSCRVMAAWFFAQIGWVAVKELNSSYYIGETLLFTIYVYIYPLW